MVAVTVRRNWVLEAVEKPFDKLRVNGERQSAKRDFPYVLSLSKYGFAFWNGL